MASLYEMYLQDEKEGFSTRFNDVTGKKLLGIQDPNFWLGKAPATGIASLSIFAHKNMVVPNMDDPASSYKKNL